MSVMKSYSSLIYFLWITFLAAPHCDCDGFMIDTHVMAKAPNQSEFELSGEAVDPRSCHHTAQDSRFHRQDPQRSRLPDWHSFHCSQRL